MKRTVTAGALLAALAAGVVVVTPWTGPVAAPLEADTGDDALAADLRCLPTTDGDVFDCTVVLTRADGGAPVADADFILSADMPSMPMAHAIHPAAAVPGATPGTYHARVVLSMPGRWRVTLRFARPARDPVIRTLEIAPPG